jgi:hypothetical protein
MNARAILDLAAAGLIGLAAGPAAVPAARAATLFGVVNAGEVFASTDEGQTWAVRSTLTAGDAVGLAAGQTASRLFLATRSGMVFRSTDAGSSWIAVGAVPAADVTALAFRGDGAILLLAETGTVYVSTDQGVSWIALAALPGSNFASLARGAANRLYALTRTGEVDRSTDGGGSWTAVGTLTVSDAVAIRSFGSALHVLTSTGDDWKSTDAGVSWTAVGTLSQVHTVALADAGTLLAAATAEGFVATSPDGVTWTWRGTTNQVWMTALGVDTPQGVGIAEEAPSARLAIGAPWPNPWLGNGAAVFPFTLAGADAVALDLFDGAGRLAARRAPEPFAGPGEHTIRWDLGGLDSGVYFARLRTGSGRSGQAKWVVAR